MRSESAPIRLLIVDDHKVVREGLRSFRGTEPGIEVVGEAADGRQALDRVMSLAAEGVRPDVVLMDLEMQPVDGIEATREIRSRYPDVEVMALTSFVEEARVHAALDAGAAGYLLKDADADELLAAVRAAHSLGASRVVGFIAPSPTSGFPWYCPSPPGWRWPSLPARSAC